MKQLFSIMAIIFCVLLFIAHNGYAGPTDARSQSKIQIALLLDTSNSMDGLINQTKSQLWRIVNEFSQAKRYGKNAELEVALFEYGNDSIPAGEGYLRMVTPLTTNLDLISENLFQLTTYGGSEYCGQVIESAIKGLAWTKESNDLRVIIIAGNEPFTQGPMNYNASCALAARKGITVNTVYCGEFREGIESQWKNGADLTNGFYTCINQNQNIDDIRTPQDDEILKLGMELNKTYIAFGGQGATRAKCQEAQDKNAAGMGNQNAVERSIAKASTAYQNDEWDLVDAVEKKSVDIDKVDDKDLPPAIKGINKNERIAYIQKVQNTRNTLQQRINHLQQERKKYLGTIMKAKNNTNTLDTVIITNIQKQAQMKDFLFN